MPTNYITLPRSKLYELVWSKPVRDVAAEFGISDVALAKRCRAINIPLPPRGYWARVAAGQKPRRPPLPPFRDPRERKSTRSPAQPDSGARTARERPKVASPASLPSYVSASAGAEATISFAPSREPDPTDSEPLSPEDAALHARIDAVAISPLATLTDAHPAVLRTAVRLKHLKSREITWPRGARSGPLLDIAGVSEPQHDRALRILDALLRTAESLGWTFEAPPPDPSTDRRQTFAQSTDRPAVYGQLLVEGEAITLRIDERNRQSDHVMTDREKLDKKRGSLFWMPRFDYTPSGELRLHATEPCWRYTTHTWKDTKRHPLETQLAKILHGLLTIALERKQHREEQRLQKIAEREAERRREVVRERRAANATLMHALEAQAGAWHRARFLRRYLRAARRALGSEIVTSNLCGEPVDFLDWAERYVNQLDPIHPSARDPDFVHERSWQYGSEEKRFTEELQRLLGHRWENAEKLA
jgi:hypothetical protein